MLVSFFIIEFDATLIHHPLNHNMKLFTYLKNVAVNGIEIVEVINFFLYF